MAEVIKTSEEKKRKLKDLLLRLQSGESVEALRQEFTDLLSSISPLEIPLIEQDLIKEGISAREIAKMCDLHVDLFRRSVQNASVPLDVLPREHPLVILYEENQNIIKDAEMLNLHASALRNTKDESMRKEVFGVISSVVKDLKNIGRTHYNREEMLLFPYLEKMGISAVPTVLWTKHDEIRNKIKYLNNLLRNGGDFSSPEDEERLVSTSQEVSQKLIDMVFRENNILYPTVHTILSDGMWQAIADMSDEYEFYKVEPRKYLSDARPVLPHEVSEGIKAEDIINLPPDIQRIIKSTGTNRDEYNVRRKGDVDLGTGFLLPEEISMMLATMPVDITFVDENDRVRFFSGGHRVFPRSKSIIGRKVQLCHPPKSVHIVNRILDDFKKGKRTKAEFYINMGGRFIYIVYYPMFRENGEYGGTLEVSMDATHIRELEGEKRLLDY